MLCLINQQPFPATDFESFSSAVEAVRWGAELVKPTLWAIC
jgi:hypothetical protein